MTDQTAVAEAKPRTDLDLVRNSINKMAPQFKAALPAHVSVEKFMRVMLTAVQTTPSLLEADRRTLFAAATRAAQMGLLPDGREGAIVTFKNQAQFMPMLGGILKLVRNSGELASIDAQIVYSNDKFTYRPGIDLVPVHEPDWFGARGDMIGVYAVAKMKDGAAYVEIMNKQQIDRVRAVSRSKDSGPWVQWYDEMARKTAIRRLSKRLPVSTDLDGALGEDETFFEADATPHAAPASNAAQHATQHAAETGTPARRSRLDKIVEQAYTVDAHTVDADGVIDMDASPSTTEPVTAAQYDDSPI